MNPCMLRDIRLSWKTKGLLFILAVSYHGRFTVNDVAKKVTNNRLVIRKHLNQLIRYGYVKKAGGGRYEVPVEYLIFEK